jgi:ribosome-associated protein
LELNTESKSYISELEIKLREELKDCVRLIMTAAEEKKAEDIIAVRVADKTIVADWFVFMSGTSALHVKSICDAIEEKTEEAHLALRRREGYNEGRWIVLDYSNILVHIFHPEEREYYNVERLWMDETTEILKPESTEE